MSDKAVELVREIAAKSNDDELYAVWLRLTAILRTKRTADELQEAFK